MQNTIRNNSGARIKISISIPDVIELGLVLSVTASAILFPCLLATISPTPPKRSKSLLTTEIIGFGSMPFGVIK